MTDASNETTETTEVKEEAVKETPTETTETTTIVVNPGKSPEEKKEAHKKMQGERICKKKKINKMTQDEKVTELKRLQKTSHQSSAYYIQIKKTLKEHVVITHGL